MGSLSKIDHTGEETGMNRLPAVIEPDGSQSARMRSMEAPNELWEWLRLLNRRKGTDHPAPACWRSR
jgi:hypothetical protein